MEYVEPTPDDEEELLREATAAAAASDGRLLGHDDDNSEEKVPEEQESKWPVVHCRCGQPAPVLTSHSEKNPDRDFYKCDKCGYFKWCDEAVGSRNKRERSDVTCHCGTAAERFTSHSERNPNRDYYRCPSSSCGFFHWADEELPQDIKRARAAEDSAEEPTPEIFCNCNVPAQRLISRSDLNPNRVYYRCRACSFFVWADEASNVPPAAGAATDTRFRNTSPRSSQQALTADICYRCNQPGHWARDCPSTCIRPAYSTSPRKGRSIPSTDVCYKCNQSGHWARDCPNHAGRGRAGVARN